MGSEEAGGHVSFTPSHAQSMIAPSLRESRLIHDRNACSSDADSDVLADYVLALIRTDAPDDEIRQASVENLEDFLRERALTLRLCSLVD